MINYSISARYNPQTEGYEYHAAPQYTAKMDISDFAEHISSHDSKYNKGDMLAVVTQVVDCIRELVLEGYRITLGDLGTFYAALTSEGTSTADEFTADNITSVKCKLSLGDNFKDLRDDAEFNLVLTREQQEAALAAAKAGVDVTTTLTEATESTSEE